MKAVCLPLLAHPKRCSGTCHSCHGLSVGGLGGTPLGVPARLTVLSASAWLDEAGVGNVVDAKVPTPHMTTALIRDLPRASNRLELRDRERGRQVPVGPDVGLESGDLLLGEPDRIGAGDEAARRLLLA